MEWPWHDTSTQLSCPNPPRCSSTLLRHHQQRKKASHKLQGLIDGLEFFRKMILNWGMGTLQGDGGKALGRRIILLILLYIQYLAVSLLQFVDISIDLFLGALSWRVLAPIFFQKGLISCKLRIWDLGYTHGNVDTKKLDLGHTRKSLCAVSSDRVKSAPDTLPATTVGMFPHFFVLPNCFTQGREDLGLGVRGGQFTNLAVGFVRWWRRESQIRHA